MEINKSKQFNQASSVNNNHCHNDSRLRLPDPIGYKFMKVTMTFTHRTSQTLDQKNTEMQSEINGYYKFIISCIENFNNTIFTEPYLDAYINIQFLQTTLIAIMENLVVITQFPVSTVSTDGKRKKLIFFLNRIYDICQISLDAIGLPALPIPEENGEDYFTKGLQKPKLENSIKEYLSNTFKTISYIRTNYSCKTSAIDNIQLLIDYITQIIGQFQSNQLDEDKISTAMNAIETVKKQLKTLKMELKNLDDNNDPNNLIRKHLEEYIKPGFSELLKREILSISPAECNKSSIMSPQKGWGRVVEKMDPKTNLFHSPIKQFEATMLPKIFFEKDELFNGYTWVLSMSEQCYYDNSLIIVHYVFDEDEAHLAKLLRQSLKKIGSTNIREKWVNLEFLGKGGFGDVFSIQDSSTGKKMAVKYLSRLVGTEIEDQFEMIVEYLIERNYLIQARKSPWVVQYIESIKLSGVGGLFFVFECCICDLRHFINLMEKAICKLNVNIELALLQNKRDLLPNLFDYVNENMNFNVKEVMILYTFEMFCALDYLSKCNIIHCDIKPENIMISQRCHLKIGDMGLVHNVHFITARTQALLINSRRLGVIDAINDGKGFPGTPYYFDMEEICEIMKQKEIINYSFLISHKNCIYKGFSRPTPEFSTDIWAMGITAFQMIFFGSHIFGALRQKSILRELGETNLASLSYLTLLMTVISSNYHKYIYLGLTNAGGEEFRELMEFLASIFVSRELRCRKYMKPKTIRTLTGIKAYHALDINEFEKMEIFQKSNINSRNAFLYQIPSELFDNLVEKRPVMYQTFGQYLDKIVNNNKADFFPMTPGYEIAMP